MLHFWMAVLVSVNITCLGTYDDHSKCITYSCSKFVSTPATDFPMLHSVYLFKQHQLEGLHPSYGWTHFRNVCENLSFWCKHPLHKLEIWQQNWTFIIWVFVTAMLHQCSFPKNTSRKIRINRTSVKPTPHWIIENDCNFVICNSCVDNRKIKIAFGGKHVQKQYRQGFLQKLNCGFQFWTGCGPDRGAIPRIANILMPQCPAWSQMSGIVFSQHCWDLNLDLQFPKLTYTLKLPIATCRRRRYTLGYRLRISCKRPQYKSLISIMLQLRQYGLASLCICSGCLIPSILRGKCLETGMRITMHACGVERSTNNST